MGPAFSWHKRAYTSVYGARARKLYVVPGRAVDLVTCMHAGYAYQDSRSAPSRACCCCYCRSWAAEEEADSEGAYSSAPQRVQSLPVGGASVEPNSWIMDPWCTSHHRHDRYITERSHPVTVDSTVLRPAVSTATTVIKPATGTSASTSGVGGRGGHVESATRGEHVEQVEGL